MSPAFVYIKFIYIHTYIVYTYIHTYAHTPTPTYIKVDEYKRLLDECGVMTPLELPRTISEVQHLRGQDGTPQILNTVLDAVNNNFLRRVNNNFPKISQILDQWSSICEAKTAHPRYGTQC
jgi:hypothetical protein